MFKFLRFLLTFIFLCGFGFSVQSKEHIIPNPIIEITPKAFPQLTSKTSLELDFSQIPESNITINPMEWASDESKISTQVYSGEPFQDCQQTIIRLPNNAKMLKLACREPSNKFVVIGNGFNSPVLVQAWPLIEHLLKKDPNLTIYLTELYGQGLTHLELKNGQITAPNLQNTADPFAHYEKDMKETFKYLQTAHPNGTGTGILFSSSAMGGLKAMQECPDILEKAILVGPYLGLSTFQKVLQWIGHRFIRGKLTADPFAESWGSCEEPLNPRLQTLEEAKAKSGIPAMYALIFSPEVCRLTSQILNPPLNWTNSANKHFQELLKTLKQNQPQAEIVIMRGVGDTACQLGPLKKLQKLLPEAKFILVKGQGHNLLINWPEGVAQEAL